MSSSFRSLAWRITLPIIIVILATLCLEVGVSVEYDSRISHEGLFMHVLHAISLFKVSGIELGEPIGGPIWARVILFLMYFAAPAVSASAIFEAVFRVARLRLRWVLYRGNHAVIIGSGRGSTDLPDLLRHVFPKGGAWPLNRKGGIPVVIADRSEEALLRHSGPTFKIKADVTDVHIVKLLALDKARAIFILTDDDQSNIDLYFRLRSALVKRPVGEQPVVFVRVRNMDLIRALRTHNQQLNVRFFNPHVEVVRSLFTMGDTIDANMWLRTLRSENPDIDDNWNALTNLNEYQPKRIVLLGFGRFGQNILLEMIARNDGRMIRNLTSLTIVSPDVENEWAHFVRLMLANIGSRIDLPKPNLISAMHSHVSRIHDVASASMDDDTLWVVGTHNANVNMQAASVIQHFYAMSRQGVCTVSKLVIRTETFSMAHQSLLESASVPSLSYVIMPTYHVLGAYYYRRIDDMLKHLHN
jgi:voltage-gated potassium channel Kch